MPEDQGVTLKRLFYEKKKKKCTLYMCIYVCLYIYLYVNMYICDTAQEKDAPRGNFLVIYAEYLGRCNTN